MIAFWHSQCRVLKLPSAAFPEVVTEGVKSAIDQSLPPPLSPGARVAALLEEGADASRVYCHPERC